MEAAISAVLSKIPHIDFRKSDGVRAVCPGDSTRRVRPAGVSCGWSPGHRPSPWRPARPPSGAFPPRRCGATGSVSAGKCVGSGGRPPSRAAGVTGPALTLCPTRGRGRSTSVPPSALERGAGPLAPGVAVDRSRTVLSARRPRRVVGRGAALVTGHTGSAAMTATHPTRLETRTKESNARASQRVQRNPAAQ